ncbi:MAG TPA: hypothetical protein VK557_13045 [Pyrinomonadaceae bacterium]|nr:hypothetical protein [Pyrinomonadaceae bacterium]
MAERDQIVDLELQSPVFVGRKIADLPLNKCEVLALTRNGNSVVDFSSLELCLNDVLTLVGRGPALKSIQEALASL